MIAQPKTLSKTLPVAREAEAAAVADPRRSYDRGAWIGSLAEETFPGSRMPDSRTDLTNISLEDLRRELERRQKGLEALIARRAKVAEELAGIDAEIRELQGQERRARVPVARGGPARIIVPRVKNSISLPDAIALAVEAGATVSPAEAAKLVLANGYQTSAAKFAMVVANALSKDGRFKRVGRGRYERLP